MVINALFSWHKDDHPRISVVSWNILAQAYVRNSLFPYAKHSVLSFKSRFAAIIADMLEMNADFFCLQVCMKTDPSIMGCRKSISLRICLDIYAEVVMKVSSKKEQEPNKMAVLSSGGHPSMDFSVAISDKLGFNLLSNVMCHTTSYLKNTIEMNSIAQTT